MRREVTGEVGSFLGGSVRHRVHRFRFVFGNFLPCYGQLCVAVGLAVDSLAHYKRSVLQHVEFLFVRFVEGQIANLAAVRKNVVGRLFAQQTAQNIAVGIDINTEHGHGNQFFACACALGDVTTVKVGCRVVVGVIIVDGHVVAGYNGAGGEIGHITVNHDEIEPCNCGQYGCLEQYTSATGIVRMAKRKLAKTQDATKLRDYKDITAKDIFDVAKEGDEVALGLVDEVGEILGSTLSNIACVTNPEVIVIGGGVSKAGQILIDMIQKHFKESCFHACRDTRFELAQLGNDAGIYGAMQLIIG